MKQIECLEKLNEFRELLVRWNSNYSHEKESIRTQINKRSTIIKKIVSHSGCLKLYTKTPPPAVGGLIVKNINLFDNIFEPQIDLNPIEKIIDMIECSIGVIENDLEFSIDLKNGNRDEEISKGFKEISNKIFIVHGHDKEMKETVARFLKKIDLEPIILHEQTNKGKTIIEKFESNSDVHFAVVLMSPDDVGNSKDKKDELLFRSRQNVIFELGYFFGKLGRGKVCVLLKDDVEKPSDYDGIIYIPFDEHDGWKTKLVKELKSSGLTVDMNKI